MRVCVLGNGLTSLVLAKSLINKGLNVDVFSKSVDSNLNNSRTLSISKSNISFFNSDITNINKLLWKIEKIEVYNKFFQNEKILNFKNNNKELLSIIKNAELYDHLVSELNKSSLFQFKKKIIDEKLIKKKYNLIINCELNNFITKKYFFKKIEKDYNSFAYTTLIEHKNFLNNNTAVQIFTEKGPIAFLPISNTQTSVVYSIKDPKNIDLENLIKKFNTKYSILKINKIFRFELKFSNLRSYYHKNILAFGDLLHKLHPLAGQGFNMTIRDISVLTNLIDLKIKNGLDIDSSVCVDFEKKTKHKNFLFANGIDFIYEFFNTESKFNNSFLTKSVKLFGKNKYVNKFFINLADKGLVI